MISNKPIKAFSALIAGMLLSMAAWASQGRYLDRESFLEAAFAGGEPEQGMLWLSGELRASLQGVLGHRLSMLRVRYWYDGETTAWILDEIGKEEPITIGVSIRNDAVEIVRILEFRESRGWEVRYPFFTDQFIGARLLGRSIDKHIDGITGATLSVGAVNRVVQMALMLHEETGVGDAVESFAQAPTS